MRVCDRDIIATLLRHFTGVRGEIVVDLRYAPLYLSVWTGELSIELAEQLFAWTRERAVEALDDRSRVAYINHVDGLRMVGSDVRRRISELSIGLHTDGLRDAMVGSWQVVSNPMVRGLLKAASWITNGAVDGRVVGDWADGIDIAVAALQRDGVSVPALEARSYAFPSWA